MPVNPIIFQPIVFIYSDSCHPNNFFHKTLPKWYSKIRRAVHACAPLGSILTAGLNLKKLYMGLFLVCTHILTITITKKILRYNWHGDSKIQIFLSWVEKIQICLFEDFSRSRKLRSNEIKNSPLDCVIYSYLSLWCIIISFNTYFTAEMMDRKYASTKTRHFSIRSDERECPKKICLVRNDLSAVDLL